MNKNSATPSTQFVWFQWLPQQTVIISLNNFTPFIGVKVLQFVLCDVDNFHVLFRAISSSQGFTRITIQR